MPASPPVPPRINTRQQPNASVTTDGSRSALAADVPRGSGSAITSPASTSGRSLVSRYAKDKLSAAGSPPASDSGRGGSDDGREPRVTSPGLDAAELVKGFSAALRYEGATTSTSSKPSGIASSTSQEVRVQIRQSPPSQAGASAKPKATSSIDTAQKNSAAHVLPTSQTQPTVSSSPPAKIPSSHSKPGYPEPRGNNSTVTTSPATSPSVAVFQRSAMGNHQFTHQHPSRSEVSLASSVDYEATSQPANGQQSQPASASAAPGKKVKSKGGFGRLGRSRSKHEKEGKSHKHSDMPSRSAASTPVQDERSASTTNLAATNPYSNKDAGSFSSKSRNRSHERSHNDDSAIPHKDLSASPSQSHHAPSSSSTFPKAPDHHKGRHHHKEPKEPKDRGDKLAHHSRGDNGGLFSSLKSSGSRAAEMFGKGLFGKNARQNSTTEREPMIDDEHYVIKVINQPLVEQTRLTRISKRLEESRDKTEFWMPAFPWRAIDYLNYKGCDVEGLYRVPGSGPQIKKWQRRFDEEYDVDLFEQEDLYDINIIGSMLKAWLRELPDELFPKAAQDRISRDCAGAEQVPQMLIDELSNLSPFNYYLLFAITCHLSLLLAHSDKNKMDYRNLCICFQPCMKIDAFCFKFLVCNWRDCWKGCSSEAQYIEEEYRLFDAPPPRGLTRTGAVIPPSPKTETSHTESTTFATSGSASSVPTQRSADRALPLRAQAEERGGADDQERAVSSSGSSKQSSSGNLEPGSAAQGSKIRTKRGTVLAPIDASPGSIRSISTTLTSDHEQEGKPAQRRPAVPAGKQDGQRPVTPQVHEIRPLSPIKPLSPLGF